MSEPIKELKQIRYSVERQPDDYPAVHHRGEVLQLLKGKKASPR